MNQSTINNLIIPLGIVILGTALAFIKVEIKKLDTKYAPQLKELQDTIKSTIGQEQYNKDVDVIKKTVAALNITLNTATLPIIDEVVKKVLPNVSMATASEVENVIIQILKGTL